MLLRSEGIRKQREAGRSGEGCGWDEVSLERSKASKVR